MALLLFRDDVALSDDYMWHCAFFLRCRFFSLSSAFCAHDSLSLLLCCFRKTRAGSAAYLRWSVALPAVQCHVSALPRHLPRCLLLLSAATGLQRLPAASQSSDATWQPATWLRLCLVICISLEIAMGQDPWLRSFHQGVLGPTL